MLDWEKGGLRRARLVISDYRLHKGSRELDPFSEKIKEFLTGTLQRLAPPSH